VEVVHESLLRSWPRLVRWQAQDEGGAVLRDQLKQAALTWDERGRPTDLLWSGSVYREFQVWRERYPGGLTQTEDAYSRAMAEHTGRRRRRRRLAAVAGFVVLSGVAGAVTLSRQQALTARDEARIQAQRAEAEKAFRQAWERDDSNAQYAYNTGLALLRLGRPEEARGFFETTLKLEPGFEPARLHLAQIGP
jgi:tetratricopeptide (TPR) repeat protein